MTSDRSKELIARMLHREMRDAAPGAPLQPTIAPTSAYHLPGSTDAPHQYGRWSNPTWTTLEAAIGRLEEAEAVSFPSGMAAIAAVLFTQLRPGDHAVLPNDGYAATRALQEGHLAPYGVETTFVSTPAMDDMSFEGSRLIWLETPSNPTLDVCDIAKAATKAKAAGALLVVDNTTMTPLGQRPLDLGADIVVASDTKALSGHSDVLMGHVASRNDAIVNAVRNWRTTAGAIPGPFEAFLAHRGLETLELRLERMCETAMRLAPLLADHPAVAGVRYPGLATDPSHTVALRQMRGFGFLIGVDFGSAAAAERFIAAAAFLRAATSFGGVHSSAERRARWGDAVSDGFVRLSVGCEPTDVLVADIEAALQTVLER